MPGSSHLRGVGEAAGASFVLGAVSTLGDWIWARFIPDGAIVPGVVHGVLVFLLIALILGRAAGTRRAVKRLSLALPVAGLVLATAFYPLAHALGYLGALLATWVGMWLTVALVQRWARGRRETVGSAFVRGSIAATGSGLAFWSVSGMWTGPAAQTGPLLRLLYWTLAFLPGFLALLVAHRFPPEPDASAAGH